MSRAWLSLFQCCGASMGVAVTSGWGWGAAFGPPFS